MVEQFPVEKYENKSIIIKPESYFGCNLVSIPKDSLKFLEKVIAPQGMILDRIEQMAKDIIDSNLGKTMHLLVIMKSAMMFSNYLQNYIIQYKKAINTNPFYYDYVSTSSYENDKSTGNVKISGETKIFESLKGKDIIIVEDMYDSGKSMDALLTYLKSFEPKSIKIACLFVKQNIEQLKYNLNIDYVGFLIPKNTFIVGFGMDFNELFRDLNHSCILSKEGFKELTEKK